MSEDRLFKVLVALMRNPNICLADKIYDVRESEGQGWDGPQVKAWSNAVTEAEAILKERGIPSWSTYAQGKSEELPHE